MSQLTCVLFVIMCFVFTPTVTAKKRCKPLLEKLHKVQALQRSGYSKNKGMSLRKREDKARDKWWQCENGKVKPKKKSKRKSKKKSNTYKSVNRMRSKIIDTNKAGEATPFKTNNAIVLKSKYQGKKKRAWLKYYQQPNQCRRPKNLAMFAFCSEDKQMQRIKFEKSYKEVKQY